MSVCRANARCAVAGALPVESGTKYSVNVWVHDGPFTRAHHIGCDAGPIESSDEAHREREAVRGREAAAQALEMDAGGEDENKDDL